MAISLSGLNGDWQVNNQSGIDRIWTRGIYSIVYSENMFETSNAGWIVKITNGVEIFGIKTDSGEVWDDDAEIIWNPNATGYDDDTTANLVISVIEEANPIDINPAYYKCDSVNETTWTGYKMKWDKDSGWINQESLTDNLTISGFTPEKDKVYNVNATSLIYLYPDMPKVQESVNDEITIKTNNEVFSEDVEAIVSTDGEYKITNTYFEELTVRVQKPDASDIREGVTLFGVSGIYTGEGGIELPTDITVTPADVRQFVYYIDANGQRQEGTMNELIASPIMFDTAGEHVLDKGYYQDCTIVIYNDNLNETNIRAGVNIFGVDGTFTSDATASSADILRDKTAYVNGELVTGTLIISESSDSNGGMKFYECAEVFEGGSTGVGSSDTIILSSANDRSNGSLGEYVLQDSTATGSSRVWVHTTNPEYTIGFDDGDSHPFQSWCVYHDDSCNFYAMSSNQNLSAEEICSLSWIDINEYIELVLTLKPATDSSSTEASWSGYEMTWQEGSLKTEQNLVGVEGYLYIYIGEHVNDEELVLKCTCKGIFTKNSDVLYTCTDFEITSDNGVYDPDTMSEYVIKKWSIELMNMASDEEIGTEEGDYWVIYTNDNRPNTLSHACFFGSSAATPADVTDWSDTPHGDFSAAGGELPAFEMQEVTSGTPTGWHKADTLTQGLSIVGFIPSVGSVYNEDTTIKADIYIKDYNAIIVEGAPIASLNGTYVKVPDSDIPYEGYKAVYRMEHLESYYFIVGKTPDDSEFQGNSVLLHSVKEMPLIDLSVTELGYTNQEYTGTKLSMDNPTTSDVITITWYDVFNQPVEDITMTATSV